MKRQLFVMMMVAFVTLGIALCLFIALNHSQVVNADGRNGGAFSITATPTVVSKPIDPKKPTRDTPNNQIMNWIGSAWSWIWAELQAMNNVSSAIYLLIFITTGITGTIFLRRQKKQKEEEEQKRTEQEKQKELKQQEQEKRKELERQRQEDFRSVRGRYLEQIRVKLECIRSCWSLCS